MKHPTLIANLMRRLVSSHRSVSQRLKRAKSREAKQLTAINWATDWQQEQFELVALLEKAIKQSDHDKLCVATRQLKAVTNKRFEALLNVLSLLSANEPELI